MKYLHFIALWLLILLGACSKDREFVNTDLYTDFSVRYPVDTTIRIPQYDTLKLSPVIGGLQEGKNYSYEWKVYLNDGKTDIISQDRELVREISLPEGNYSMQLSVRENASGVTALSEMMTLSVSGVYYEGWFVTSNIGNQGMVSFLREDGVLRLNILEEANAKLYAGRAVGTIAVIADGFFNSAINQIMYFTDRGLTMFDPASLLQITETNQNLFAPISFNSAPAFAMNMFSTDQYLIGNGGLFAANIPFSSSGAAKLETFSSRFTGDYNLFPFIFPDNYGNVMVYDNKGKRFFIGEYYGRTLFADKVIGKTMLGTDKTLGGDYLALFKQEDKFSVATCALSSLGSNSSTITEVKFSPSAIDETPCFAASSEFPVGYYSADNKLYSVNAANGSTSLLYTFPQGTKIGAIQMMKEGSDMNRKLVIGVNSGNSGEVYYLYLGPQGNLNPGRSVEIFKGFGNIVHLSYRTAS